MINQIRDTLYVIHIRHLNQTLNHALALKKVCKTIIFNQNAWLKPYIDMNTDLRKKVKNQFEKDFFKLMNNAFFWKNYGKCQKTQRYKTCGNRKKKELFSTKTIFSYHKVFQRKGISDRNKQN